MRLTKLLLTAAAVSMTAAPVMASAATPASKLSISAPSSARVGAKAGKSKASGGILIAILAVAAVGAGVWAVADSDDEPDSK